MSHEKLLDLCEQVDLPIEALTQPIALLANREGGKTYGGMKIFELAYDAGVQCGVLDPVGKWWGLRLGKDGKSAGLKDVYIFGGKHADFPLQSDKGAFIARLVVEKRIHFILDVSLMRKGERRRFMATFLEELHLLKKQQDNPTAMVLFLEEAHFVAPQKPQSDEAQMLGAIQDVVAEGRNAGIGIVLMDQRPARVNKDVLALVEVLIALRIIHNLDRAAIEDWIVQKTDSKKVKLSDELPFFKKGAGYLYAPVYELFGKIQILPKRTYDSTASVKIGQHRADIGQLTPVDAEAVKSAMAEVLQEAKANDPKFLRRRVAELEHQLKAKAATAATATKVVEKVKLKTKTVTMPLLKAADVARLEKLIDRMDRAQHDLEARTQSAAEDFLRLFDSARPTIAKAKELIERAQVEASQLAVVGASHPTLKAAVDKLWQEPWRPPLTYSKREPRLVPTGTPGDAEPGTTALAMLRIVAQLRRVSRKDLAMMTGYSDPRAGAFRNRLYEISGPGLVAAGDSYVQITDAGWEKLGTRDVGSPPTASEVVELWRSKLKSTAREILDFVLERGQTTRRELAEHLDYSDPRAGAFRNRLYEVTGPGIVEAEGGDVRPAPLLVNGPLAA